MFVKTDWFIQIKKFSSSVENPAGAWLLVVRLRDQYLTNTI